MTPLRSDSGIIEAWSFGEALSAWRNSKGFTQEALGQKLNYDQGMISRWESGERLPDVNFVKRFARVFTAEDVISLFDLNDERTEFKHGVKWIQAIPDHLSEFQRGKVERGISIFRQLFVEKVTLTQLESQHGFDNGLFTLYPAFQAAVFLGALRIVEVSRSTELEHKIRKPSHRTLNR